MFVWSPDHKINETQEYLLWRFKNLKQLETQELVIILSFSIAKKYDLLV
jgi:hypothetical protein